MLNFKQFITEMPEMNSFLSKERVRDGSKDIDLHKPRKKPI